MTINHSPRITTDGMILCLDAANQKSYPGSGNTIFDISNSSLNATLVNGVIISNNSLAFTQNSTNIVTLSNSEAFHFLNRSPFTLEVWIQITEQPATSSWRRIINKESTLPGGRDGYNFWVNGNANPNLIDFFSERFVSGSGFSVGVSLDYNTLGNKWNHWVVVYNGTQLTLYRNANVVSGPLTDTRNLNNNVASFVIGSAGGTNSIGGNISNLRVYNRALSLEEIQRNFVALRSRFGI